jgi:hypothetical protein
LRVTRYGLEVTSAVLGFIGTMLVLALRKRSMAEPSSATEPLHAAVTARLIRPS